MNKEICLKCPRKDCYIAMDMRGNKVYYCISDNLWELAFARSMDGKDTSDYVHFMFMKHRGEITCEESSRVYSKKLGREVSKEEVIDLVFREMRIDSKSGCVCCTEQMVDGWNGEDEDRKR